MKTIIPEYNLIVTKVRFFIKQLNLKLRKHTGRPLSINPEEVVALSLWKQSNGIPTKKAIWKTFKGNLKCSYKTLAVNMNKLILPALLVLKAILKWNQKRSHIIKHTDSTDIPVCLNKNAKRHKTMRGLAEWGHSGKGLFYGLKMHITTDLNRSVLKVRFSAGNTHDKKIFLKLNKDLMGIFIGDAAYISKKLSSDFHIEGKRILFAKPRKNMKKIMTTFQEFLYGTRMRIELNFRSLKMFYGLITSIPRSINGYLANYIYSLLAFQIA